MTIITSNYAPPGDEATYSLLQAKRKRLDLTRHQLRRPWIFRNPQGEVYMFARFKRAGESMTIATVAWYNSIIGVWLPL